MIKKLFSATKNFKGYRSHQFTLKYSFCAGIQEIPEVQTNYLRDILKDLDSWKPKELEILISELSIIAKNQAITIEQ